MSVIPFVVGGSQPTVVETQEGFEQQGGLEGHAILIRGMDACQLSGDSSNISYDLRVGCEYRDHRDIGKRELGPDKTIRLYPGSAVILQTEEFIHLPKTRFACVVPKVSLLQEGLSNTMSKVDPGYQGHLLVTLFNLGQETVELEYRQACCSLCVFRVDGDVRSYNKKAKRIEGDAGNVWWQNAHDWMQRNIVLVALVLVPVATAFVTQVMAVLSKMLLP